jgi:ADP-ribose pyrophosphatase
VSKIIKPTFHYDDVEILDTKWPHDGFLKVRKMRLRFRQFDGSMSAIIERELFTHPFEAVGVLLYDPPHGKICLVEQFRAGAIMDEHSPWQYELVMGMVDAPSESFEAAAIREAEEEAGAHISDLIPIHSFFTSPGTSSERMHLYCATVDSRKLGGVFGLQSENENIKAHVIDLAQAEAAIAAGQLNNAATLIAIQWLLLNRKKFGSNKIEVC